MSTKRKAERAAAISALDSAAKAFPALRLCQLIGNAVKRPDAYYVTDGDLAVALLTYIEENRRAK